MRIPELLFPLVSKGVVREEQVLTYWKDTLLYTFDPGARKVVTYKPRTGYVYLVFGMTFGRPRNYDTGDEVITDDYGFWHRHSQMRWHWDPAVESIYEYEYPYFLQVTRDDPLEMEFINNAVDPTTGEPIKVIQDFSIFILECSSQHWSIVQQYLKGLYNLFSFIGRFETQIEKELKKLEKKGE